MPMEIRPIPGQPGLFRQSPSLGAVRWSSTYAGPTFKAPFGNRGSRRSGLSALPLPAEFISAPIPEHIRQMDVPKDQIPGVEFKLFVFTPGPLVPQTTLDSTFRGMLGQLGYDVSSSVIGATPITFAWTYTAADKSWEAKIATGPAELIGMGGWKVVYDAPTAQDLQGLPAVAESYLVVARPKDNSMSATKMTALLAASRAARATLSKAADVSTDLFLTVKGVPPAGEVVEKKSGLGLFMGLLVVGGLASLALKGKTVGL